MKSYSSIWIHLIWTTKERQPLLDKTFRGDLIVYMKQNAVDNGILLDCVNGIEDHLHGLVRLLPAQCLSDIVKQLKGSSSHWIYQNKFHPFPFSWQAGYGALSVNPADIKEIRQYIFKQEVHHHQWGLDQEIKKFKYYI
jgi:REP element-mobilizing transposase RayT